MTFTGKKTFVEPGRGNPHACQGLLIDPLPGWLSAQQP
jgi:hypothetical protein